MSQDDDEADAKAKSITIFLGAVWLACLAAYEVFAKLTRLVATISIVFLAWNLRWRWLPFVTAFAYGFLQIHTMLTRPGRIIGQPAIPDDQFCAALVTIVFGVCLGAYCSYRVGLMPR